jgi:hypothetical protein
MLKRHHFIAFLITTIVTASSLFQGRTLTGKQDKKKKLFVVVIQC